jgi:glycosyltransferase involved in cell wall biosynthesis
MNNPRVGFVLPYAPGEAAQMACVLADYLEQLGCRVDMTSSVPLGRRVHPRWDARVRKRPPHTDFLAWARKRQRLVWFEIPPRQLLLACGLRGCRHICVPLWPHLTAETASCLAAFDSIVAPSAALTVALQRCMLLTVRSCPWDSCGAIEPSRHGTLRPGRMQVLVLLDRDLLRRDGLLLLLALSVLLDGHEGLEFTLAGAGRWGKGLVAAFSSLRQRFGTRLRILRELSHESRRAAIRAHDWVFCASPSPGSGIGVTESLCLGVPAIAYNIPPYNEVLVHGYNGAQLHLPSTVDAKHLDAISVQLNSYNLLEGLTAVLGDEGLLTRVQSRDWRHCENTRQAFRQLWRQEILDVDSPLAC